MPFELTAAQVHTFRALHVFSSDQRFKLLLLLDSRGDMNVGAMSRELGITQPSVSSHVAIMLASRVVTSARRGKNVFYSLTPLGKAAAKLIAGFES